MKCGNCGHELKPNAVRCLRCGWVFKGLALHDDNNEQKNKEEPTVTKEIPPSQVHVSKSGGGGSIFGDIFGGNPFGDIFGGGGGLGGLFGNFFGDIFGGGADDDDTEGYEYDPKNYDDFGNEIYLPDEFERDCVEIQEVEEITIADENDTKRNKKEGEDKDNKGRRGKR